MDEVVNGSAQIHRVSSYLLRFDDLPEPLVPSMEPAEPPPAEEAVEDEPEESPEAPDELESLRHDHDELVKALQVQRQAHDATLEEARRDWSAQEGDRLAARLANELAMAFESLRFDLSRVLTPFVSNEIRERAVEDLERALRNAIIEAPVVQVEGPKDLLGRFADALSKRRTAEIVLIERETVDVRVDLSGARLETRLEEWMQNLRAGRSEQR
jgi:hypothetical protein